MGVQNHNASPSHIIKFKKEQFIKESSKKLILAAGAISTVGLASLAGVSAVSAQSGSSSGQGGLIDAISSKFNLNKEEVKQVFEAQHEKREAEHEAKQSERLQKLVDNGTITVDQKTAIETKLAELKSDRESNKGSLTPEQRKAKQDEKKAELEAWAEDKNLDLTKLKGVFMGGPDGRRGPGPMGERPQSVIN